MLQIIDFFRMRKLHLSNNLFGRLTEKYVFFMVNVLFFKTGYMGIIHINFMGFQFHYLQSYLFKHNLIIVQYYHMIIQNIYHHVYVCGLWNHIVFR